MEGVDVVAGNWNRLPKLWIVILFIWSHHELRTETAIGRRAQIQI
jgi:hypothetical protein